MSSSWRWLRRRLFGISPRETTFARRGFVPVADGIQQRLEQVGRTFVDGYHAALEVAGPHDLARQLNAVEAERRGFAFEGAAMALALLDRLTPWKRNRWLSFVKDHGEPHLYMVHVGIGWALARLPVRIEPALRRFDPLLRWLVVDGYGFHEGYFHWRRSIEAQAVPRNLSAYARRAFDQGLGRSLWFVNGADGVRIAETIRTFASLRQADLWSGVGLASAYAGGVGEADLKALGAAAGSHQPQLCQGVAFAAKARQRAGNPADHTELACRVLCGLPAAEAAQFTDIALENLSADGPDPAYEVWRRRIQAHFASFEVARS